MTNTIATPPASRGPTPGDWRYYRVTDSCLPSGFCHLVGAFTGDGDQTSSEMICELEPLPEVEANGAIIGAAPGLLRAARSAAVAFGERISCLRDDLAEGFGDSEDIQDQIDNYQFLLDRHAEVIAEAEGRAA